MSISRDELIARANELGEGVEIPDELLESIAGGANDPDTHTLLKFMAIMHKASGATLEEAIEAERTNWHRPQDELDYIREIWDSLK